MNWSLVNVHYAVTPSEGEKLGLAGGRERRPRSAVQYKRVLFVRPSTLMTLTQLSSYYIDINFSADDMIETENTTLRERVNDLEKKVLEQGDEIICLRSTLANVVRRLEQVEGFSRTNPDTGYRYGNAAIKNGSVRSEYQSEQSASPSTTTRALSKNRFHGFHFPLLPLLLPLLLLIMGI